MAADRLTYTKEETMSATEYVTKGEFTKQKARLTRAINSGDPLAVLTAVEQTLDEWSGKAWPDDWHRWRRAFEDAFYEWARSDAYDDDREDGYPVLERWHRVADRLA